MTDRIPEHLEAEQAVLCALLTGDQEAADIAFDGLTEPGDFARGQHAEIFAAMRHLHADGRDIDVTSLSDELDRRGKRDEAMLSYVSYLLDVVASAANIEYHLRIVRGRALERRLLTASADLIELVHSRAAQHEELAGRAEAILADATARAGTREAVRMPDLMLRTSATIDARTANEVDVIGIPSGLTKLDELTGGFRNGQMALIAARPSEGKTSLSLHIAQHAAVTLGIPTAFFSLEMGADELAMRLLAADAMVDLWRLERGRIGDHESVNLAASVRRIAGAPLIIDEEAERTVGGLRATARHYCRREGTKLVIIDYAQLIGGDEREENRQQEMRMVSKGLKAMAKQLQIPVLVCCQLNRQIEQRGANNSRPKLSDLRESGAWEQDADLVIAPWKDPERTETVRTLIVLKQRNGPKGEAHVVFDEKTGRWEDVVQGRQAAA